MEKIITDGCPSDEQVMLEEMSCRYYQNPDCCSGEDDFQEITITTKDGGGGKFFNLKTNEEGWSFSEIDEIVKVIEDFIIRLNINTNKNESIDSSGCTREGLLEETSN